MPKTARPLRILDCRARPCRKWVQPKSVFDAIFVP
jgi:hypothetical protein